MYTKKIPELMDCGVSIAIRVLGGKWKTWIIDCIHKGIRRPSAMHRVIHTASPRVINMQLKELESHGIVEKKIHPGLPLKVEYYLTPLGQSIMPIIDAMENWGLAHRDHFTSLMDGLPAEDCFSMEQDYA